MARRRISTLAAVFLAGALCVHAQDNSPPPGNPPPPPAQERKPGKDRGFEDSRRKLDNLPPEQRERFGENLRRWQRLPDEERRDLRQEDLRRRERIAREIDEAIRNQGLKLNPDQREVFALRYTQERRRIEAALRRETEEKRSRQLGEMVDRLKKEFAATSIAASPSPSPSPSPGPAATP